MTGPVTGADFVRANTVVAHHPLVPEIALHLATEITPIWQASEVWLAETGVSPPFWAFAWPGSAALARHVLDHPEVVRGLRVLDFAAGGGLAAIACRLAGAASVEASDIDPLALLAMAENARLAGVDFTISGDLVGQAGRWDLILCGDVCYEAPMTAHILPWLQALAATAQVWIADPGRAYVPRAGMTLSFKMTVPTTLELEDHETRDVTVWRLAGT